MYNETLFKLTINVSDIEFADLFTTNISQIVLSQIYFLILFTDEFVYNCFWLRIIITM